MVANLAPYWFRGSHEVLARDLGAAALGMRGAAEAPRYIDAKIAWAGFVFRTGLPAGEAYASALAVARERHDVLNQVQGLVGLARVAARDGRWYDLRLLSLEALDLARTTGNRAHERLPVHALAFAARMAGDYDEARRRYRESIALCEELGMDSFAPPEYRSLGHVELNSQNTGRAARMFRHALRGARQYGMTRLLPYCVFDFGALGLACGELDRGAILVTAAMSAFEASGIVHDPDDNHAIESAVRALRDRVDAAAVKPFAERGGALTLEQAVALLPAD
jgi:tetratricopeptide (TPR) repeat protein